MNRRHFLKTALLGAAAAPLTAALPKMKITRVRFYESPLSRPMFNQSFNIVTIETDQGITGIGKVAPGIPSRNALRCSSAKTRVASTAAGS